MKKNVDITIDIKTARRMLGVAGIVTTELIDEEIFKKVLDWIKIYGVTYSINQD